MGPGNGAIVAASPTITGAVTDVGSGVATVRASIDGQPFFSVPFDASGHFTVATHFAGDGSADGAHTVVVVASDVAGNQSASAQYTFTLSSPINFAPIGPLSVMPGHQLSVVLSATSPQGLPVTFSLRSSMRLPTGTLNGNRLTFSPSTDRLGSYQLTLVASDGVREATQVVPLDVVADPVTTTRISGQVLGTDGRPLAECPDRAGTTSRPRPMPTGISC